MNKTYRSILQGIAFNLFGVSCFLATPYFSNDGTLAVVGIIFSAIGILITILSFFEKDDK